MWVAPQVQPMWGHPSVQHAVSRSRKRAPRLPAVDARRATGYAESAGSWTPLSADHDGDDLRRRGGGGHALHRRRSKAESNGPDRTDGCTQPNCRGKGNDGMAGTSEDAQDIPWTYLRRLSSDPG